MTNIFYWAQALDNTSADYIFLGNIALIPEKISQRQEIVSSISKVTTSGSLIYQDGGVKLTEFKKRVVMEVDTCQRDNLGRLAPLVACFDADINIDTSFIDYICSDVLNFAQRINRSISPDDSAKMLLALNQLKKAYSRKKNALIMALFFLICIVVILFLKIW